MKHRQSFISRIRQNHAIEHATLHTALRNGLRHRLYGISYWGGFWLLGNVDTPFAQTCATRGLDALMQGQSHLAIHPRCGTNIAVAGFIATLGTVTSLLAKAWWVQIIGTVASLLLAIATAPQLGKAAQRHITTTANIVNIGIHHIKQYRFGRFVAHQVVTEIN